MHFAHSIVFFILSGYNPIKMKKYHFFSCFLITGLLINSCTLPSAVEVKAKASMHLPVKSGSADLGVLFSDSVKDGFSDGTVYDCPGVETLTLLMYFAGEGDGLLGRPGGGSASLAVARGTAASGAPSKRASESTSLGDYMEGFKFIDSVQARLYVSSDKYEFLNKFDPKLTVTVTYTDPDTDSSESKTPLNGKEISIMDEPVNKSLFHNYDEDEDEFYTHLEDLSPLLDLKADGLEDGEDGEDISFQIEELLNIHPFPRDLKFSCKLEPGDETGGGSLTLADFTDAIDTTKPGNSNPFTVELFIWLPLEFTAGADGGKIKFPEMFDPDEDLFGRSRDDDDDSLVDIFHSLRLEMTLSGDTFSGGMMNIPVGNGTLSYPISGESLVLDMSSGDRELIKKTVPFAPDIGISFEKDKELKIPKNLGMVGIGFSADIDYTIDL
jgi:hypothetical protein